MNSACRVNRRARSGVAIDALPRGRRRIVLLLERNRKVHVRAVRRAEDRLPRWEYLLRAKPVLAHHSAEVAQSVAREPQPERALLEELTNAGVCVPRIC